MEDKYQSMSDYLRKPIDLNKLIKEPGAAGILSDYRDYTDPKYTGPGTWNVIHRTAYNAQTHEQQLQFIIFMKLICKGFPCKICKGHCTEYIASHPMEDYLDVLIEIEGKKLALGLFIWSWKFHNAVNARLNKPLMTWDTAYNLFSDTESLVCSKHCMEAQSVTVSSAITPSPISVTPTASVAQTPFRLITAHK